MVSNGYYYSFRRFWSTFFPRIILHNQLALTKFGRCERIPSIRWCSAPIVYESHREIRFAYLWIFVLPVLESNVAISYPDNLRLLHHFLEFTSAIAAWVRPRCLEARLRLFIRALHHLIDGILLASSKFGPHHHCPNARAAAWKRVYFTAQCPIVHH